MAVDGAKIGHSAWPDAALPPGFDQGSGMVHTQPQAVGARLLHEKFEMDDKDTSLLTAYNFELLTSKANDGNV
jgi:hypothetical protein